MAPKAPASLESPQPVLEYRPTDSDARSKLDLRNPLYPFGCIVAVAVFGLAMYGAGRRHDAELVVVGLPLAAIWYILARLNRDPHVPRGWLPLLSIAAAATVISAAMASAGLQQKIAWWRVYDKWPDLPIALIVSLLSYCAIRFGAWLDYRSMR